MALDTQVLDANFSGLINPEIWAADPMLRSPTGVVGLFDTQSMVSYPWQAEPDAAHQLIYNRAPSAAVPSLQFGLTSAIEATDPSWSATEGALVLARSALDFLYAPTATQFQFTNQGFLMTTWFKPTPAFSTANNQSFASRHDGNLPSSAFILYNAGTTLNAQVLSGNSFVVASSASGIFNPSGNTQVGLSWQPLSGSTGIAKVFLNGAQVGSASTPFGTLNAGAAFTVGNGNYPADIFFKRLFIENLSISGNDPATRIALEYAEISQILS
jgi:hypothetical protein